MLGQMEGMTVKRALVVLRSLNTNSRQIFRVLADFQLQNGYQPEYQGVYCRGPPCARLGNTQGLVFAIAFRSAPIHMSVTTCVSHIPFMRPARVTPHLLSLHHAPTTRYSRSEYCKLFTFLLYHPAHVHPRSPVIPSCTHHTTGYSRTEYYKACRNKFLVASRHAFTAQLNEYKDHHLINIKKVVCVCARLRGRCS